MWTYFYNPASPEWGFLVDLDDLKAYVEGVTAALVVNGSAQTVLN